MAPRAAGATAPPSAATLVLTNRALFRLVMDFVDGVPGRVVSLAEDFQRAHRGVPWSASGALPRAAIQRGDVDTLRHLRRLSTFRRFQARPELALDGATRCAVQSGQLQVLQYLAATGMLLGDSDSAESLAASSRTVGATLLGWAVRYSETLRSPLKLEIVQWVANKYSRSALRDVKAEDLSRAGVPVLRFLAERRLATSGLEDPRLVDLVATMGKMQTLRLLEEGGAATCTADAMDGAAANGHLEIVRYLHAQRTEGCTVAAMDGAARNGHMEVVQFLHSQRAEGCTAAAMDGAARNGHLDMVQFLHANRTEGCTTAAMDGAAAGGFLELVRFLHEHRREGCTTKAMNGAARSGHLDVVKFLHLRRSEGCTTDAMDGAALLMALRGEDTSML
ncbi:Ankyrin repeat protein [Phytophthora cinnamomi]|uniref:Ankyrin repeat protein n=1 Tax=Phytophthora cinnamomi TaxID=4785 RepID=UPI003559DB76|nr:Ankyrin repeat protein [Phytophthora cinnamomi]